jgi:flagellar FliJ protein|tara:strand:- start:1301 stop:1741 length:441 start_codon:yes stop_codon:yes gene_type:complete
LKKKSDRLKIVLDLAERKEKAAMEELSKKRRYRDEQLAQLENLKQYHFQYLDDIRTKTDQVNSTFSLQANLQFLTQVDAAIQQQENVLKIAEYEFSSSSENWMVLHQKRKGMSDLIESYKKSELQVADKKEQQQIESDLLSRRYRS